MSETPEYMSLSAAIAASSDHDKSTSAAESFRQLAAEGRVAPAEHGREMRYFISPHYPNSKWLAVVGTVIYATAPTGSIQVQAPAVRRDGDVWVRFTSGVCATDNEATIEWLVAHSGDPEAHVAFHRAHNSDPRACGAPIGLCREQGQATQDWYEMKQAQIPLATRPVALNPDINVDQYISVGGSSAKTNSGVDRIIENSQAAERERAEGIR